MKYYAIIISFCLHLALLLLLSRISLPASQNSKIATYTPIELIQAPEFQEMRTVGKKDGKKNENTLPSPKAAQIARAQKLKNPLHNALARQLMQQDLQGSLKSAGQEAAISMNERPQEKSNARNSSMDKKIPGNANLNFKFETPEGVSFNELNEAEQVFYAFRVRTDSMYKNALYQAWQQIQTKYPYFHFENVNSQELLQAKIVIDQTGHRLRVQFTKGASYRQLDEIFETAMMNMENIPNPPRLLFKGKDSVTLYFQLSVNM